MVKYSCGELRLLPEVNMNPKRAKIVALSIISLAVITGLFLFFFTGRKASVPVSSVPENADPVQKEPEPERFDPGSVSSGAAVSTVIETEQGGSINVHFKPEGHAPAPSGSVVALMNTAEKSVADAAIGQLGVRSESGRSYFSYHRPEVPGNLHLSVSIEVFNRSSETLFRNVSDAGWLTDPSAYDSSEKDVVVELEGVSSLKDKMVIVSVKVGDSSLSGEMAMYQIIRDYDGSQSVWAVNAEGNAAGGGTRSELVNMQYGFFEEK